MKRFLCCIISLFISLSNMAEAKEGCKKECRKKSCESKECLCIKELSCGCILLKKCECDHCVMDSVEGQCLVSAKCNKNKCNSSCSSKCSHSCKKESSCNTCNSCLQNNFNCRCFERGRVSENWEWPHSTWP